MRDLYGLILAGGSGVRLWPMSREYYPKQFLKLIGDKTLIQQTFLRLRKIIPPSKIFITTNRVFIGEIVDQLKNLGFKNENIITQPSDKDTGPAIAHAAKIIHDVDQDAVILNCPSDHLIQPQSMFSLSVKAGYRLAKRNLLVTFGIKPTEVNPEYGYITRDAQSVKVGSCKSFKVKRFIEKPSVNIAKSLVKNGSLWNSGIFVWKSELLLQEVKRLCPDIYQASTFRKSYFSLVPISIDKGVLEKSDLVWVIPVSFEWKDIGSWKALYDFLPKDKNQNVVNNKVAVLNCTNSLIYAGRDRTVAAINLRDIIVVDTEDSVLVSHRENVHEVKRVLGTVETSGKRSRPLVTLIVPTYNDSEFIDKTLASIVEQTYKNIELIVIDGGSSDQTLDIIDKYRHKIECFVSMPNSTKFERINKGIDLACGEVVGAMDSHNSYIDNSVITDIIYRMEKDNSDIYWGDLVYFANRKESEISMFWKSSEYQKGIFRQGWFPPYPTLFVRKKVYERYGSYNTELRVSAEYELTLRLLGKHGIKGTYIPRIIVKMTGKGLTWGSVIDRFVGNFEIYKSWKLNGLGFSPVIWFAKHVNTIKYIFGKKDLKLSL